MPPKNRNQQSQFHFRLYKKLSIIELRKKYIFRDFNCFANASFQTEELSNEIGNAIVDVLQS